MCLNGGLGAVKMMDRAKVFKISFAYIGLPAVISSNSFALRWRIFSSEVEKLKWFSFDLALKLALYT